VVLPATVALLATTDATVGFDIYVTADDEA